jgi:hypothetical protein
MELGIWLSFVKTWEFFLGGVFEPPNPSLYATAWHQITDDSNLSGE